MSRTVTPLGYALLGLIGQAPRTGYALVKLFRTTPLGRYSGSPGAIYPALKALETGRFVQGVVERSGTLRPRRSYRLTAKGRRSLHRWLAQPIAVDDAAFRQEELMLRFALMEGVLDQPVVVRFLEELSVACDTYATSIERHRDAPGMTLHGTLALESGIASYRASAAWAKQAIRHVRSSRAPKRSRRQSPRKGG